MQKLFICPTCGATKTLNQPEQLTRAQFLNSLPGSFPCGVGGCEDRAIAEEEYNARKARK